MTGQTAPAIPATSHLLSTGDARRLDLLAADSVDLVVTSPPYPMIAMWDDMFQKANDEIRRALENEDGRAAFRLMHGELEPAWAEILRAVKQGGFICVNIGDATRTVDGAFRLYPNHVEIEHYFFEHGADILPRLIWRKTTNAPNKFMGSGMLPAGAYVTLEHEYILIIRKRGKRDFSPPEEKARRRRSALFWEERNAWFSDLWELGGARQKLPGAATRERSASRTRSGAFPFELAYRLIGMYSLQGDLVLDPFAGTGTTALAALALARNSIGIELDEAMLKTAESELPARISALAAYNRERIERHIEFVAAHRQAGKTLAHVNGWYGFPVKTAQERELVVPIPVSLTETGDGRYRAEYETNPKLTTRNEPGELPLFD